MRIKCTLTHESFTSEFGYTAGGDAELPDRSDITLVCGRRDWAAFQILVQAEDEYNLCTGTHPVFSPAYHIPCVRIQTAIDGIPDSCLTMHPVGTAEDDDRIEKSDLLLELDTVFVERKKIQPVWGELKIPEDTEPGTYRGKVRIYSQVMFEDEKHEAELPFTVEVKNVMLPEPSDFSFYLDLWQHCSNIARKHETTLWSDDHFTVLEGYVKSLADLGQKAVTVIVSEIPWSGQRCFRTRNYLSDLFEYSMVAVKKKINGTFMYDYSAMERYIRLCGKYGIHREIEVFGLVNIWTDEEEGYGGVSDYPDAVRIRYLDEADGCYKYMDNLSEITGYIKALETYFSNNGLMEKVRIAADEPADIERYRNSIEILNKNAPAFKLKTAINHVEFIPEFKTRVDQFVPNLSCACKESALLQKLREKEEKTILWYVCCNPDYPNTFISSPLAESRLLGLMTSFMNLDGFLRWNYTVWPENPRERISYRFPEWRAGDTNFVYPGNNGRPILTLRYKNLKRGIEDFELINLIKKNHPDADHVLSEIWNLIFNQQDIKKFDPDNGHTREELYSLDHGDYVKARRIMLDNLSS
jgi:hypothetical protein